jgi:hypothetical protein
MVCKTCDAESFAWLAEIFVSPVCGDDYYVFPISATEFDCESQVREGDGAGEDENG